MVGVDLDDTERMAANADDVVGTDACAVPVLVPQEAAKLASASIPTPHPQISVQRSVQPEVFESKKVILAPGKHTQEVLKEYGLSEERVRELEAEGIFGKRASKL